ncbi:MAG: hypothetical protein JSV48_15935, partial [Bradyrhizobium sp.]
AIDITIALAIGAAAAERRTLLEDPALVLVLTARTIAEAAFAARMLVPVGALARPAEFRAVATTVTLAVAAGPVQLGTVVARTIEFGTLAERTIPRGAIIARPGDTRTVIAAFALLPGLVSAAIAAAEILARAAIPTDAFAIRSAARELALAVEFAFRTVATRGAITAIEMRAVSARLEAALAAIFTRPAVRPSRKLALAVEFALRTVATWGVGLLVAELPVAGPRRRAGLVAVAAARRTVAAIGRPIAARLEGTLLAIARGAIGKRAVAPRLEAALAAILARPVVAIEFRPVAEAAARGIAVRARARRTAVAVAAGRAGVAPALGAALGELLLGATRLAGTAFGRSLGGASPAAGIVVFVAVARHE